MARLARMRPSFASRNRVVVRLPGHDQPDIGSSLGTSAAAVRREEVIRTVFAYPPEVASDLREPSLGEEIEFQPMELEPVLLPVRENFSEQGVLFGHREFLSEGDEGADRFKLPEPGVERAFRHIALEPATEHPARFEERASQVVRSEPVQDYGWRILSAGELPRRAVPPAVWAVQFLHGPSARLPDAGLTCRFVTVGAGK